MGRTGPGLKPITGPRRIYLPTTSASDRIDEIRERIERPRRAAAIIEAALRNAGHPMTVDPEKLTVSSDCIHETTGSRTLSEHVCDAMYPHEPGGEFFHYTGRDAFKGIAANGVLWLAHLLKRIKEHEISTHADQHGYTGYTDAAKKTAYLDSLAKDLFYTSVTPIGATNDGPMWFAFAEGGTGVRLRLRIEVDRDRHHGELRKIRYLVVGEKTLLNLINEDLRAAGFPEFLPWTTSKIGAFCLPKAIYGGEYEVRLLYKFHPDVVSHAHKDPRDLREDSGTFEYWKLPLNKDNDIASVTLLGIEAGPNADMAEIRSILAGSGFSGVNLTQAP